MKKPRLLLLKIHQENMFHLTFPDISHKSRYLDMIEEWKNFEPTPTSPGALFHGDTYEEFLKNRKQDTTSNRLWVPATLYFFMDDEDILWEIQIRHSIDHPRLSLEWWCGGHIGYGLRPIARGRGLATEMLRFGLIEAKKLGIEKILISAHEDNPASWKTIERLDGEYLTMIDDEGKNLKVYWITL